MLNNTVKHGLFVLVVGSTLLSARGAFAYRPFDGTDADVADPSEVELEIGPIGYVRAGSRNFLVAPALIANYGVVERWELVLEGRHQLLLGDTNGEPRSSLTD